MKKIIIILSTLLTFISFSNVTTGKPNVKLSAALGFSPAGSQIGGNLSLGVQPEWTAPLNKEWEIGLGPVFNINTSISNTYSVHHITTFGGGVTFRFDAKKRLSNNHKVYVGAETGIKIFNIWHNSDVQQFSKVNSEGIFAVNAGVEYKNGFYFGGFVGHGKGLLGLELGYRTR